MDAFDMPSISHPLWLLAPLIALAILALGRRVLALPGTWHRAIENDLQAYLTSIVVSSPVQWRRAALFAIWLLLSAALATISMGHVEVPKLRNLDARIVVIDLGIPEIADDRIAAARYLIDGAKDVPTAVVAVTEYAFDVVPLTRDATHLDRYLQVLTKDVMPVQGRSLLIGIERAAAMLDRAGIQARQITVFTGGTPPEIGRFQLPDRSREQNIWFILPGDASAAWQAVALQMDAELVDDSGTSAVHVDFEERRQEASMKTVSLRERHDMTPWLILMLMPLWLSLFFRRRPD
jgi:hypothetical protein